MSKSAMIRVRVEPDLKEEVESVFKRLGMSVSEAISVFYRQVQLQDGMPFDVKIPNRATRKVLRDSKKGKNLIAFENEEEVFKFLDI